MLINNAYNNYKIVKGNEKDQADLYELNGFIQNRWISTLGNSQDNKTEFVSKNFKGTIQNDNLTNGPFIETLLMKPLHEPHLQVNGYANGWLVNPAKLCLAALESRMCKEDYGKYDFELLVEFWPQRLSYLGYSISAFTMLFLLLFTGFNALLSQYRQSTSSF